MLSSVLLQWRTHRNGAASERALSGWLTDSALQRINSHIYYRSRWSGELFLQMHTILCVFVSSIYRKKKNLNRYLYQIEWHLNCIQTIMIYFFFQAQQRTQTYVRRKECNGRIHYKSSFNLFSMIGSQLGYHFLYTIHNMRKRGIYNHPVKWRGHGRRSMVEF